MTEKISEILLIGSSLGLVILVILYLILKRKNIKVDDTIFTKKKVTRRQYDTLYTNLENFPGLKHYTRKVRGLFELYIPGDERLIKESTVKLVLGMLTFMIVSFVIVLLLKPTVYMLFCTMILIFVINDQTIHYVVSHNEAKLLRELDNLLELLQFNFLQSGMIDEALKDCMNGKNKLIERHAQKILDVMCSDNIEDALYIYNVSIRNKYLKELMCICVTVYQYGDAQVDGKSSFLDNLKRLKDRIGNDCVDKEEVEYNFRLLPLLCIIPLFAAQYLEDWAIANVPELEAYFKGYYGFVITIVCAIIAIGAYILIGTLRSDGVVDLSNHDFLQWLSDIPFIHKRLVSYYTSNYGKELQTSKLLRRLGSRLTVYTLAVKRFLFSICTIIISLILLLSANQYIKYRIVHEVTGTGSKSSAASEEDSVVMMLLIKGFTDMYLDYDVLEDYYNETGISYSTVNDDVMSFWKEKLIIEIENGEMEISEEDALQVIKQYNTEYSTSTKLYTAYLGSEDGDLREYDEYMLELAQKQLDGFVLTAESPDPLSLEIFYDSVADDVIERVMQYQNAYVHWYQLLLCLVIGCVAFMVPYWWILYNKRSMSQLLANEVMQFHSLIMILMPIKGMSAQTIMDWMLIFSQIFHDGIHTCTVKMPAAESKAFEDLIASEPYEPFQDIIRKMEMCDRVGVQNAFSNIDVTRNNYTEKSKQDNRHRIATNSDLARALVMIPTAAVLAFFMIVPFLTESFGQLSTTLYEMSNM